MVTAFLAALLVYFAWHAKGDRKALLALCALLAYLLLVASGAGLPA